MDFINEYYKLIISIGCSTIGLGILLYSRQFYVKGRESLNWQITDGTILTSDVIKEMNNSGDHNYSMLYRAEVCYSYKILNEKFVSNKISFMPNFSTSSSKLAYKRTLKYAANSKVQVYYNPTNPEEAVLEPGVKTEHIVFLSITSSVFLTALGFVIYFLFNK
jgi:hypothetical protein